MFIHVPSFSFIFLHFLSFSFKFFHFLTFSFMFFHFLSFFFIFVHFLSFVFFLFHFLSFSFIFFHFLLFSFIFFHFLSFSFIFFRFLSFSFILLGAQNLIFFGTSISLRFLLTVLMEKSIFGPIPGTPFGPSFPFFPTFFSPVFLSFSCFLKIHFSHFLFISSFFDFFNVFHFLFSFSEEKVSSFLFTCISFKYF